MASPLDLLVSLIHSRTLDSWKEKNTEALGALFGAGARYPQKAEKSVALRSPEIQDGVSYAAYIHPSNPTSGAYGGMSFVIFPAQDAPCLVAMVIGTQGLAPDEAVLGRPGHARKLQAVCAWLNQEFGNGELVAWAKHDPTRVDIDVPKAFQSRLQEYDGALSKYGRWMYAVYRPTDNPDGTLAAVTAMLDIMFEERGIEPLAGFKKDAASTKSKWFEYLMPTVTRNQVAELLKTRRYVIIQGPPGTGKTRMARKLLSENYSGVGQTIQFHSNTTYENFVGGLAPVQEDASNAATLGFRFAPKQGSLMEAAALALKNPARNYLLHIDEINRADLGKVLGEAIYLLEPEAEERRELSLAYDFGEPFFRKLSLPGNLHILGTMNSSDRSIAILDVAVRRRFAFLSLWPSLRVVEEHGCALGQKAFEGLESIFIENATEEALALVPGHSYFLGKDEKLAKVHLQTSLLPLLTEYLAQGYVSGFAEPIRAYLQWLESL
jgi:5-methylcytosine-specific restriction protein B